ncbi:aconitate hydratase [bacterium]|nr:aconitate hydratase [bacterium]
MKGTVVEKILKAHLVEGELVAGSEIGLRIDQTLTQDSTGTMAYLQFEALGVPRVKTELSVAYVDHNTLQSGPESADDHKYLQTVAARHGVRFSRPGNGICHQVHLERFGAPGKTLLGSDSHTPTAGGIGMLGIGAGGLDVAVAMAGMPYFIPCPQVLGVRLTGQLSPWVAAKDVILELLRRLTVKGGVGRIVEYCGPGVATLSVPERATITNMGAELGATSSLFPADDRTRDFLAAQDRAAAFTPLAAEADAEYDELIELDLSALQPMVAQPHSPDAVVPVADLAGRQVDQVCIGSCTNSSYRDMMMVAAILKGRQVHPDVSLTISPGSRQVLTMLARNGALADMLSAGARVLESACGPCIGMGQAPLNAGVSVRSFNRNFEGRSGTKNGQVFLASPEVCAAAAVAGEFVDPQSLGDAPQIELPAQFEVDDRMVQAPAPAGAEVEVVRGPNIKPVPTREALSDTIAFEALLKVGDNITTDHISPAGAKYLPLRSNVPALSEHVFEGVDPSFAGRALDSRQGAIIGGDNYGQGSSREHAAMCPLYLGIQAVLATSFARIHKANLINFGILPLEMDKAAYEALQQGDKLQAEGVHQGLRAGVLTVRNLTQGTQFETRIPLSERQQEVLLAGGMLNYVKARSA